MRLQAAMILLQRFGELVGHACKPARLGVVQELLDLLVQRALIAFERQHVLAVGFVDLFGDLFLAAHRVHRDHTAGQFQGTQQLGQRSDLIALVGDF